MTSASEEKWRPFNCFLQYREQVVIRRIRLVIKRLEAQEGQFLLDCRWLVSWSIVLQEQTEE